MNDQYALEDRNGITILRFASHSEVLRFIRALRTPGVANCEDAFRIVITNGEGEPSRFTPQEVLGRGG